MSDSEHEEDSSGMDAGIVEQLLVGQPVQAGIWQVLNFQVSLLDKFSFKPEEWLKWIQRFERFCKTTGLEKQSSEHQVNMLIYLLMYVLT